MGCVTSFNYCNRRNRSNRNNCNTNSISSLNQIHPDQNNRADDTNNININTNNSSNHRRLGRNNEHRSPSFSNHTSNSFHSTGSFSNPNSTSNQTSNLYSYYVPPTGKNKRLKKDIQKYFKSDKKITESQLKAKREEFWDTAPAFDGKPEIWSALKAAVDAVEAKNFTLAQAIIDSANIILPNGLLSDCYDELGNRYQIPIYVLAKPSNLIKSKANENSSTNDLDSNVSNQDDDSKKNKKQTDDDEEDVIPDDQLKKKKKGKNKKNKFGPTTSTKATNESQKPIETLQIKLRVSTINQDLNNDIKEIVSLNQTVLSLKNRVKELANVEPKNQRFYFGGKLMRDKEKLKMHNLKKNVVIQVIVREDMKQTIDQVNFNDKSNMENLDENKNDIKLNEIIQETVPAEN